MAECYRWDFTLKWDDENNSNHQDIVDALKQTCKLYTFQLEEGESGYKHYQGRISLIKKKKLQPLLLLFSKFPFFSGVHWSPTSNNCKTFDYAMKLDTRISGPWTDKDEVIYIPRQVREMEGLRPFQQSIIEDCDVWNKRIINVVYCESGNMGKSLLVGYCRAHKIGRALPPINDSKDLLRMVCDLPTSKMYLFDMPRSMNKDRLYQFYSAVETIKDGYAYDDRYHFKEKVFDCPNIWIFTNTLPDLEMLSEDRWKVHTINKSYELIEYIIDDE
ncbi:replication protein [uncultured marine virus]|nr:replication protein [uncultured marine virus]